MLSTQYDNFEVIIADNGSTDDSVSFLQSNYSSIRLIRFTENLGFAKGYNEALKQVVARLDLALSNLPEFPVVASGDLEIAWQILMAGEANIILFRLLCAIRR